MSIYLTSDLDLQFAAHGLVGVNYFNILNLFMAMDSTANAMDGDDMSLLSEESVSESVSSLFAEELGEGFVLNKDITQAIKKQIDLFANAMDGDNMSLLSESVSESMSSLFAEELGEGFVLNKDITQAIKKQMDLFVNAMDGDDMSLLSESVSESMSSLFAEELGEGSILSEDITQAIKKQIDLFVDAMKTEGGRRLTFGGLEPFLSACFCDYTDDAISCDAVDENGVLTILGGDSLFTTGDLNLSGRGPVPYYASVSAACFDDINGQGHVSETTGGPPFFECYSNNRFGHSHGGKFEPVSRVFLRVILSTIS